jgi:hypothetical protein
MKPEEWRKVWLSVGATAGLLAVVWFVGTALAQGPDGGETLAGDVSLGAMLGSKINYQGRLTDPGGVPLHGTFPMRFQIYNDGTGGTMLWDSGVVNVDVEGGLFNKELSVDPAHFNGQALWLRINVDGEWLSPRQELLPVPYALSLRPGARVSGDVASPSAVINALQPNASSAAFGLYSYGPTTAIYGDGIETGVRGHSYGHIGGRAGVYGDSVMGTGVYGSSLHYNGVYGETSAAYHDGGHFVNKSTQAAASQAGVWAGTYWGNIFEGYEVDGTGNSVNLRFNVTWDGYVYADGTYTTPAADMAELLPASEGLEPGDVLVIGPDGQLARSSDACQPTIVGVYSTKPGFLGGVAADLGDDQAQAQLGAEAQASEKNEARASLAADGKVPLAIAGIVPVKVSTENGPIQPGDLLTTSSLPGHAMKASPIDLDGVEIYRPATIIGKALEPLGEGTGVISVLITLQ